MVKESYVANVVGGENENFPGMDASGEKSINGTSNGEPPAPEPVVMETRNHTSTRKCCKYGPRAWCKKYWWEGQELAKPQTESIDKLLEGKSWSQRIMIKHRRLVGFCIPAMTFHFFYWALFIEFKFWTLFPEKYAMTITMIIGSLIAGMTSEGGGAVAFPVLTLALGVDPSVARDVSMMVQGCGMSCASFTIFFMKVCIEWTALICCSLGGIGGVIFGLYVVDPALSPKVKKLGFVSIWFAFASVLVFLNRVAKRRTFNKIQNVNWWKILILFAVGFLGGTFTSFSGSGLDICSFMIMTLLFRISEKVATPTTVILMAFNSLVGLYWRGVMLKSVSTEAWEYLAVVAEIVTIGAPVGSVLGSHFHRIVLASFVIIIDVISIVTAFAIIPMTPVLIGGCVAVIVGCFGIFMGVTFAGQKLLDNFEAREHLRPDEPYGDTIAPSEGTQHTGHDPIVSSDVEQGEKTGIANPAFVVADKERSSESTKV